MPASPASSAPSGANGAPNGSGNNGGDAVASGAGSGAGANGSGGGKRRYADPEYIALSELLNTFSGEIDGQTNASADPQAQAQAQVLMQAQARKRLRGGEDQELLRQFQHQQETASSSYQRYRPRREREAAAAAAAANNGGEQVAGRATDPKDRQAANGTPPTRMDGIQRKPPTQQQSENRLDDEEDTEEEEEEDAEAEEDEVDDDETDSLGLTRAEDSQDGSSAAGRARKAGRNQLRDASARKRAKGENSSAGGSVSGTKTSTTGGSVRHTKLAELEKRVRGLERDNLHLKQALLLGKNAAGSLNSSASAAALASLGGLSSLSSLRSLAGLGGDGNPHGPSRSSVQQLLGERTKVVTEMVELLNASCLSLGDASRVWHEDCRIGVGVREWDAFGRLEAISLWNMIRCVFASIAVDIVELRPHLSDGEMILTKWRIQGEIASAQELERVCASEDCPPTMRVALMAIKSSDLTFTVTTYVIFQELHIAEQHHCWDQVGVFKRLFGGEIPASVQNMLAIDEATATGQRAPLEV